MDSHFQASSETLVAVRALVGTIKAIQSCLKTLPHCRICGLREPSAQSEILGALGQVFIKYILIV